MGARKLGPLYGRNVGDFYFAGSGAVVAVERFRLIEQSPLCTKAGKGQKMRAQQCWGEEYVPPQVWYSKASDNGGLQQICVYYCIVYQGVCYC